MTKFIKIKNRNGLQLSAIVETPGDKKKYPLVILLHGFKGYKEEETYIDLVRRFLEEGVATIRFDASGFGASEGTLEDDYRFSNYVTDTECVYEWLVKQSFVDTQKITVVGQSMGAGQTLCICASHPEIVAGCAISPPDKIGTKDGLGDLKDQWKKDGYVALGSSRYKNKKIKVPYAYLEDALQYDFTETVQKVSCPLLFVVGGKDETVLPEQTIAVYKAANDPKQLLAFAEMTHFYKRDPIVMAEVHEKVVEYVLQELGKV